jgi:hypothetical protein
MPNRITYRSEKPLGSMVLHNCKSPPIKSRALHPRLCQITPFAHHLMQLFVYVDFRHKLDMSRVCNVLSTHSGVNTDWRTLGPRFRSQSDTWPRTPSQRLFSTPRQKVPLLRLDKSHVHMNDDTHRAGAKSYWVTRSAPSSHAILDGFWAIAGVESDEMVCGSAEILSLPRAQRPQLGGGPISLRR